MSNRDSHPPFDLEHASAKLAGDEEILKELAEIFLEGCTGNLELIQDSVRRRDAKSLNLYAHRLKSSLSNFFAREASETANEVERIGRESDWQNVDMAMVELEEALKRLLPALAEFARSK